MQVRLISVAAAAALALTATRAAAQAAPPQPPAVAANSEEALVRRYLAAIHFERSMDALYASLLPVMAADTGRRLGLSAEDQQMITDVVREVMHDRLLPMMIDRFVPIYAATFSRPELEALVSFYESPIGRSITDKVPTLAPRTAEIVRALLPTMQQEVVSRICAKRDCGAQAPPPAKAS